MGTNVLIIVYWGKCNIELNILKYPKNPFIIRVNVYFLTILKIVSSIKGKKRNPI